MLITKAHKVDRAPTESKLVFFPCGLFLQVFFCFFLLQNKQWKTMETKTRRQVIYKKK